MKLSHKFSIIFVLIGLLTLLGSSYVFYKQTEKSLKTSAFSRITAIREGKKREIETYFLSTEKQILSFTSNLMTVAALEEFTAAYKQLGPAQLSEQQLKRLKNYYSQNFLPAYQQRGSTIEVASLIPKQHQAQLLQLNYLAADMPTLQHTYTHIHDKYNSILQQFQKRHGFYDVSLIDLDGNVVYTAAKEIDFATNLIHGPHSNSGLAEIFRHARDQRLSNQATLNDFKPYIPSFGKPEAFIASPITRQDQTIGIAVFQLPIDQINNIMTSNRNWRAEGFGDSGESYILAEDFSMRNDSRFIMEEPERFFKQLSAQGIDQATFDKIRNHQTTIYFEKVRTSGAKDALAGNSDTRIILDYRNVPVFSSYTPLQIKGLNWVLLSEIDVEEVFRPLQTIKSNLITLALILTVILITLALWLSHQLVTPLTQLQKLAGKISRGDYSAKVAIRTRDEVGKLAEAFNRMMTELAASTTRLQSIIRNAQDGIIVITDKGTIVEFSPSAEKIFGCSKASVLGSNFAGLVLEPDTQEPPLDLLDRFTAVDDGYPNKTLELIAINSLGTHPPIELTQAHMVLDGQELITVIVRDISERKEAEQSILESMQAAQAANQVKSDFLSNISHEIRTPMNAVVGMTSLLQSTELNEKQHHYIETMQGSIGSLMAIINDILDFSQVDTGQLVLHKRPFQISQIIQRFEQEIGTKATRKNIQLSIHNNAQLPDLLSGDESRIIKILLHLGDNAIKFSPRNSQVALNIYAEQTEHKRYQVDFVVKDQGPGITPAQEKTLFQAFTQVDGSTTRQHGGVGMGLAISKNFAELMGGRLWLDRTSQSGATFHFSLQLDACELSHHQDTPAMLTEPSAATSVRDFHPTPLTPQCDEKLLAELQALYELLQVGDITAIDKMEQIMPQLINSHLEKELSELKTLISNYDFDQAAEILRHMLSAPA